MLEQMFNDWGIAPQPGAWTQGRIPITRLASGIELTIPVHVLSGVKAGPSLCLVSTAHGNEVFSIGLLKHILEAIDLSTLQGTVIALPVINPLAMDAGTRNTPTDMLDLNRLFPGKQDGTLSERMAVPISKLVSHCDCIIDYHCGTTEVVTNHMLVQTLPGDFGKEIRAFSCLYGLEMLHLSQGYPGSLTGYAAEKGIPALVVEIGGGPVLSSNFVEGAKRGVWNIMKTLGMLSGEPELPQRQILIRKMAMLRPSVGGVFQPDLAADQLGQSVPMGTPLGRIFSPHSLQEEEVLTAPYEKTLLILMRTALSRVQPGDFAYFVGDMSTAEIINLTENYSATT